MEKKKTKEGQNFANHEDNVAAEAAGQRKAKIALSIIYTSVNRKRRG